MGTMSEKVILGAVKCGKPFTTKELDISFGQLNGKQCLILNEKYPDDLETKFKVSEITDDQALEIITKNLK